MDEKTSRRIGLLALIILILLFTGFLSSMFISERVFTINRNVNQNTDLLCNGTSIENCPNECAVCPPCAECSSISCQSVAFCKSIGFEKDWYDKMQRNRLTNP